MGPFRVVSRLGQGATAAVYIVEDTRDGRRSALKLLRPTPGDLKLERRFRREFQALARLNHPNLLRAEEWGVHRGRPWFTMEHVDGSDLRSAMAHLSQAPQDEREARIRDILTQVARALAYIHDRGMVHRDVSPGNIMLRSDGVIKLTDFGLVRDHGAEHTSTQEILGTIAYTAPEQLQNLPVDGRADLYALGVVLYELLTGRKPFRAHTVQGWVQRHIQEIPDSPRQIDPLTPEDLDSVCMRLLAKQPDDRFASAWHLLASLGERPKETLHHAWPPRVVGRLPLRSWIHSGLEDVAAGRPGLARALVGPSGSGKTRLLQEAAFAARRLGLPVASIRCRPHDPPYGAFASVIRRAPPDTVPALLRSLNQERAPSPERWRVLEAFLELLRANTPLVVLVDGLEHADTSTQEVVSYLVRNTVLLDQQPLLFLLCAEGADRSALPIGLTDDIPQTYLGPLSLPEVEELILGVFHDRPSALVLADRLHRETGGSPSHLADMLRALIDNGLVSQAAEGWRLHVPVEEIADSDLPLPASLRVDLAEQLAPLGPQALQLARLLCLHPGPLEVEVLLQVWDGSEQDAMDAMDHLIARGVVLESREEEQDRVELGHARFRDVLLESVDPKERQAGHRALGECLERRHRHALGQVLEALAWHFEQAGLSPKAFAYLARSGARHLKRELHDTAARQLDRALLMAEDARPYLVLQDADLAVLQARLHRAEARHRLGQMKEAIEDAREALRLAEALRSDEALSKSHGMLGALLRWSSRHQEAEPHLRSAIEHGRATHDDTLLAQPTYHLGVIAWTQRDLDIAEARWHHARELSRRAGDQRASGLSLMGLGTLAFCRGDADRAREQLEASIQIFESLGIHVDLAIARVNLVELNLCTGLLSRALSDADRTVHQARALHQPAGVAKGLVWRARCLRAIGRLPDAQRCAQEALAVAERIGSVEEEVNALATLTAVLLAMDLPRFALPRVVKLRALLREVDLEGSQPFAATLHARTLAAMGDPAAARAALREADGPEQPFAHVAVRMWIAAGKAHLALHEREAGRERLLAALSLSEKHGFRYFSLLAHQGLVQASADPQERGNHAQKAKQLARLLCHGLSRDDAATFRQRGWGTPGPT